MMRSIRNFIYNFSDIFVALLIIGLAAFLIWTRIDVIMDYPNSNGADKTVQTTAGVDVETTENYGTTIDPNDPNDLDPDVNYKEIVIPSGSSTDVVAGILKQYGLVVNVDDFTWQVKNMGVDGQLLSGTFHIPEGTSMSDLIKILCGTDSQSQDSGASDNSSDAGTNTGAAPETE